VGPRKSITVVIADPEEARRDTVAEKLAAASGTPDVHGAVLEVIGHAESDEDAINVVLDLAPDVALVSVDDAAAFDGRTVCLVCAERMGVTRLIAVAESESPALYAALRSGAFSTYLRSSTPFSLARTVWGARRGESVLSSGAAKWLLAEYQHLADGGEDLLAIPPDLVDTEREILEALADGVTPQEIADQRIITLHMVNTTVGHSLAKLHRTLRDDRELKLARQADHRQT
jgi:DNA-binding NarL/FixJ family response regulator